MASPINNSQISPVGKTIFQSIEQSSSLHHLASTMKKVIAIKKTEGTGINPSKELVLILEKTSHCLDNLNQSFSNSSQSLIRKNYSIKELGDLKVIHQTIDKIKDHYLGQSAVKQDSNIEKTYQNVVGKLNLYQNLVQQQISSQSEAKEIKEIPVIGMLMALDIHAVDHNAAIAHGCQIGIAQELPVITTLSVLKESELENGVYNKDFQVLKDQDKWLVFKHTQSDLVVLIPVSCFPELSPVEKLRSLGYHSEKLELLNPKLVERDILDRDFPNILWSKKATVDDLLNLLNKGAQVKRCIQIYGHGSDSCIASMEISKYQHFLGGLDERGTAYLGVFSCQATGESSLKQVGKEMNSTLEHPIHFPIVLTSSGGTLASIQDTPTGGLFSRLQEMLSRKKSLTFQELTKAFETGGSIGKNFSVLMPHSARAPHFFQPFGISPKIAIVTGMSIAKQRLKKGEPLILKDKRVVRLTSLHVDVPLKIVNTSSLSIPALVSEIPGPAHHLCEHLIIDKGGLEDFVFHSFGIYRKGKTNSTLVNLVGATSHKAFFIKRLDCQEGTFYNVTLEMSPQGCRLLCREPEGKEKEMRYLEFVWEKGSLQKPKSLTPLQYALKASQILKDTRPLPEALSIYGNETSLSLPQIQEPSETEKNQLILGYLFFGKKWSSEVQTNIAMLTIPEKVLLLQQGVSQNKVELTAYLLEELRSSDKISLNFLLQQAIQNNRVETLKILLKEQPNLEQIDQQGRTPLIQAIINGNAAIVKLLVDHKVQVEQGSEKGFTPLRLAAKLGYSEVVEVLLQAKAKIDDQDTMGYSALILAALENKMDVCKILIQNGANTSLKDENGMTALMHAIIAGAPEGIETLIEHTDPNLGDNRMQTALHFACAKGRIDTVKLLVQHQANLDVKNAIERTPLHVASRNGNQDIVKLLAEHKANVNAVDQNGVTPLLDASLAGHLQAVEVLLKNGADIKAVNKEKSSPLHCACNGGWKETAQILLQYHADPNQVNANGETPLIIAAQNQYLSLASLLLENGADVNHADNEKKTSLLHALEFKKPLLAAYLVKKGARLPQEEFSRKTEMIFKVLVECCKETPSVALSFLKETFSSYLDDPDARKQILSTLLPLFIAHSRDSGQDLKPLITWFLHNGAELNGQWDGRAILPEAVKYKDLVFINMLVEAGASVDDFSTGAVESALGNAVRNGDLSIMAALMKHGATLAKGEHIPFEDISQEMKAMLIEYAGALTARNPQDLFAAQIRHNLIEKEGGSQDKEDEALPPLAATISAGSELDFKQGDVINAWVDNLKAYRDKNQSQARDKILQVIRNSSNILDLPYIDTIFLAGIIKGDEEVCRELLSRKIPLNQVDRSYGATPLIAACIKLGGHEVLLSILETPGVDVNQPDKSGATPLMHAAKNGNLDAVAWLLKRGADPSLVDSKGRKALDYAAQESNPFILSLLRP